MTDTDLEAEFLLGWATLTEPGGIESQTQSSRIAGESKETREKRLRQARECSAHRRSVETAEKREKRLREQRERMAQKRRMETAEEKELR